MLSLDGVFLILWEQKIVKKKSKNEKKEYWLLTVLVVTQVSAYSSFARIGVGLGMEHQRRRMDPTTNEPLFTHCTRDFIGTLDYIFYTGEPCNNLYHPFAFFSF